MTKKWKISITARVNDEGLRSFRIDAIRTGHHIWEIGDSLENAIKKFDKEFANSGDSE